MVVFSGLPQISTVSASEAARINLLNNGGFTAFPNPIEEVTNSVTGNRELIDRRQYEFVTFAFSVPESAGSENVLGYWDVWGASGNVTVNPKDTDGTVFPSFDGGNLIEVSFNVSGTINLDQALTHLEGLRGREITVAFSGRRFSGDAKVSLQLVVSGEAIATTEVSSGSFGRYRRVTSRFTVPENAPDAIIRISLEGKKNSDIGLSGVTAVSGPSGDIIEFTDSIADCTMPSGLVILYEGDTCPAGYMDLAPNDELLILATSGYASVGPRSEATFIEGSDTHDHSPDSPTGTLGTVDSSLHDVSVPLPLDGQAQTHVDLFDDIGVNQKLPQEVPIVALGVDHAHRVRSNMTSVPPSFPIRFCQKI